MTVLNPRLDAIHLACIKPMLTEKNINLVDKMNFNPTVRISQPQIWSLLQKYVPGSLGIQIYLKILYYSYQSFLLTKITIALIGLIGTKCSQPN